MKLIILAPITSTWSRKIVMNFLNLEHQIYLVDFSNSSSRSNSYMSKNLDFQKDSIENFKKKLFNYVEIHSKIGKIGIIIKAVFSLKKIKKQFNPDAVFVLYGGFWGLIAYLSKIKPYYVYIVGSDILIQSKFKNFINRVTLNNSDHVFSNGKNLLEKAKKIANKAKISNIYIGVDLKKYSYKPIKNKNKIKIICTRRFEEIYNNKYLIEALSYISNEIINNIEIIFTSHGSLLSELQNFTNYTIKSPLLENIHFCGGITDDELIKYLQNSDIYISLSFSDGSSISLLEAFACGVFPILSDIPANREWINEKNGILVPFNNPKEFACSIERAIKNEHFRNESIEFNRKLVDDNADASKNFLKLYHILNNN